MEGETPNEEWKQPPSSTELACQCQLAHPRFRRILGLPRFQVLVDFPLVLNQVVVPSLEQDQFLPELQRKIDHPLKTRPNHDLPLIELHYH